MMTGLSKASPDRRTQNQPGERIIGFVRDRFLQEGFSRTSVDDIASGLSISKKTFYKSFLSKEKLIEEVVESVLREVRSNFDAVLSSNDSFIKKFHQVMSLMGQIGSRIGKPFLNDLERQMPHLWDRIETFRHQRIQTHFADLLKQGVEEGYINPSIDRQLFLQSYLAAVNAIVTPTGLMHESFSAREAIQHILLIFFHGALTPAAKRQLAHLQRNDQKDRKGTGR